MVPPANFAMVDAHVYRCGRPSKTNIPFLESLNLKSIVYLSDAVDLPCNIQFAEQHGVKYFHFRVKENKEPFQQIDQKVLAQSLVEVVDIRNHPMLIYSDRGKHRIGCLVGCLRKLQKWSMASIFDEYQRFSGSKIYIADQEVVKTYFFFNSFYLELR
ncbi:protein-tyrosine phosphatase [Chytriomyces cf. hyalinus JEL632]|nr:protein-tyrosine phosphatase [Chytriomyces cf. hyalinus JEL632]